MKIFITTVLVLFFTLCSTAQTSTKPTLSNTTWKGHIEIPQSMDIVFEFRNDTLIATSADMVELERMFFSQSGDTLKLKKLSGTSPCDDVVTGYYQIEWQENGDKIVFHSVKDECVERANAITSALAYFRIKK